MSIDAATVRRIAHLARIKVEDGEIDHLAGEINSILGFVEQLKEDNLKLTQIMREVHDTCDEHGDVATASLLENWIDESERRTWFLFETTRQAK